MDNQILIRLNELKELMLYSTDYEPFQEMAKYQIEHGIQKIKVSDKGEIYEYEQLYIFTYNFIESGS